MLGWEVASACAMHDEWGFLGGGVEFEAGVRIMGVVGEGKGVWVDGYYR